MRCRSFSNGADASLASFFLFGLRRVFEPVKDEDSIFASTVLQMERFGPRQFCLGVAHYGKPFGLDFHGG